MTASAITALIKAISRGWDHSGKAEGNLQSHPEELIQCEEEEGKEVPLTSTLQLRNANSKVAVGTHLSLLQGAPQQCLKNMTRTETAHAKELLGVRSNNQQRHSMGRMHRRNGPRTEGTQTQKNTQRMS